MTSGDKENKNLNYRVIQSYADLLPVPDHSGASDTRIKPDDRILLLRLSAIGDSIRMLPVVEYLRSNDFKGKIDVLTEPPSHEFLKLHPGINMIHTLPLSFSLESCKQIPNVIRTVRNRNYNWVFDFHGLLKSGVTTWLTGVKNRVGFSHANSRELNQYFQSIVLKDPLPAKMPRILKYLQMVRSFTPSFNYSRKLVRPRLSTPDPSFNTNTPADKRETILVHPFTSHSKYGTKKEWGNDRVKELSLKILEQFDVKIQVSRGPGEYERARSLVQEVNHPRFEQAPKTPTLEDLASVIHEAKMLISVDTSTAHMADLLGVPLVVLYWGTKHFINAPLFTENRYLAPHPNREAGIRSLSVENVYKAVLDLYESVPN